MLLREASVLWWRYRLCLTLVSGVSGDACFSYSLALGFFYQERGNSFIPSDAGIRCLSCHRISGMQLSIPIAFCMSRVLQLCRSKGFARCILSLDGSCSLLISRNVVYSYVWLVRCSVVNLHKQVACVAYVFFCHSETSLAYFNSAC
jgi:hypothetical protein